MLKIFKTVAKDKNARQDGLNYNSKLIVNKRYDSHIEDIGNEKIVISMPTHKGVPLSVTKNSLLHISVILDNSRIAFESKVLDVIRTPPVFSVVIGPPETFKEEQLRGYFRVPVHMHVKFHLGKLEKMKFEDIADYKDGFLDDISGGGCRMSHLADLHDGDVLVVDFEGIDLEGLGHVECNVLRVSSRAGEKKFSGLQFSQIKESVRDRIISYVHKRQAEIRKLRL